MNVMEPIMLKCLDIYPQIIAALAPLLVGACTATTDIASLPATPIPMDAGSDSHRLLRQGRYTLVELRPDLAQRDLQRQIIDLRIPATPDSTVGDALRYVLLRSGYRLCDGDTALSTLLALPLPAAHRRLGPLELRQALQLLAGNAWRLVVDEQTRQACFVSVPAEPSPLEVQP